MGGIVDGMRPISTSPANINALSTIGGGIFYCLLRTSSTFIIDTKMVNSTITREIVAGLLRPISTFKIVNIIINYLIARVIVAGLKITISTSSVTRRHFKTFIIINTIIGKMVRGIMASLARSIS